MTRETRQLIKMILKLTTNKASLVFWFFIRFISALFPLLSVYLFSRIIKLLENGYDPQGAIRLIVIIFSVFVIDNLTRLLSTNNLNFVISNIQNDIHNLLSAGLKTKNKKIRYKSVQAIRNFSDATNTTLTILKQPGIDSIVSFVFIPIILFFLDFRVFILQLAYMLVYFWIDVYTTERYVRIKDIHNAKVEIYYAKFQDSNKIKREEGQLIRQFKKLCRWNFFEWFTLQTTATAFYSIILLFLVFSVFR
ncbi:hypothetical protein KKE45_03840, partial [Patescibacteria group bacterium]|nr:hypothetical protein [Patescibacteria group bacterium]